MLSMLLNISFLKQGFIQIQMETFTNKTKLHYLFFFTFPLSISFLVLCYSNGIL